MSGRLNNRDAIAKRKGGGALSGSDTGAGIEDSIGNIRGNEWKNTVPGRRSNCTTLMANTKRGNASRGYGRGLFEECLAEEVPFRSLRRRQSLAAPSASPLKCLSQNYSHDETQAFGDFAVQFLVLS